MLWVFVVSEKIKQHMAILLMIVTQIIRKCITDLEFGPYTLLTKLIPGDNCHGWPPTILMMIAHQPKDGHPPILTWSPSRKKCTTDMEFGTYTLLTKLIPGDNCHGWSPTILRMVTYHP